MLPETIIPKIKNGTIIILGCGIFLIYKKWINGIIKTKPINIA